MLTSKNLAKYQKRPYVRLGEETTWEKLEKLWTWAKLKARSNFLDGIDELMELGKEWCPASNKHRFSLPLFISPSVASQAGIRRSIAERLRAAIARAG
ncbi:hypothetical protein MMC28_007005 [Mycoblastus sanguinarius]|nr:hypothetical protein [Mycoblastus sanguinarius]